MAELPEPARGAGPRARRPGCSCSCSSRSGSRPRCSRCTSGCPDSYPTRPEPGHRGVRRAAHQDRRLRDRPHPDAAVPGLRRGTLLLYVAAITMVVGVLGAIAQNEIKRILSFHIVSQIGYMVFGIAIGGVPAIAATIFFLHPPDPDEDVVVPRRGHGRALDRDQPARPAQRSGAPVGVPRAALPAPGAEPVRDPAVLRFRRQARARHGRVRRRSRVWSSRSRSRAAC